MKLLTNIILLNLICFCLKSQIIEGVITDENTNEPLIGANVILENGEGTATDIDGKYLIATIPGKQKVTFKYLGYSNTSKEIELKKDEKKIINVSLKSVAEELGVVVISAGRFEQKLEEITVSMEVIKPTLIENKNTTNIQTAMDQIPGVNITDGQANIRGGSGWSYGAGTRVLVMVDDMPLISGDAGQAQWSLIATENINQVEVIKGASSALYGSSALNGVMNIRTAFPSQKMIDKNTTSFVSRVLPGYTKINMHFGLIDKPKRKELNWNGDKRRAFKGVEFLQSMKLKNLDLSFGGNIFNDDGYRLGEKTDRKRFNLNSTYKNKKIKGLSYGINANVLVQNSGSLTIWNGFDEAYIPLNRDIITTEGLNYNVDPFITYINGNNKHNLKTRHLSVLNKNLTNNVDVGQSNSSKTYYTDYQWQKNITQYNLIVTNGLGFENTIVNSDLFNGESQRSNQSLYTQIDKKTGKLNISLGARYEAFQLESNQKYYSDGDSLNNFSANKPVFRTGLNYQIAKATFIRSSWGQGYRFPAMSELFIFTDIADGIYVYPNAALKPESGWSSEIGLKQGVKYKSWVGYLDIAGFVMQYDDMMEFTFGKWADPEYDVDENGNTYSTNYYGLGFKSVNVGKTQISGIEISLSGQGKINNNLTINLLAGYTYMKPISLTPNDIYASYDDATLIEVYDNNTGEYLDAEEIQDVTYNNSSSDPSVLKYRYQHVAKIDLELLYKKISIGSSLRYNDVMRNIDAIFTDKTINEGSAMLDVDPVIPGINQSREKLNKGQAIIDARLGYKINEMFKFGCIVNNVNNLEYMSRPANMMSPRTIAIQLAIKI